MNVVKKLAMTLLFPILMFLAMLVICALNPACHVNGNFIFLDPDIVRQVFVTTCQSSCVALAIWIQLKNGRFDFSGGASMILAAIFAGTYGYQTRSPWVALVVALVMGVVVSLGVAAIYVFGRLPIVIATIGVTLLYESLTYLVCGGNGVSSFYQDEKLPVFGHMPGALLPLIIALVTFLIYDQFTSEGRKGKVLSKNQAAGVNIGIAEKKNVFISYIFRGIIIGCAALIYVSQNIVSPQASLSTAGVMFSYIVPVYMGMFIGMSSTDYIGIVAAAIGMAIMNYGLSCMNLAGSGWQQIIMGLFVLAFYTFEAKLDDLKALFKKKKTA